MRCPECKHVHRYTEPKTAGAYIVCTHNKGFKTISETSKFHPHDIIKTKTPDWCPLKREGEEKKEPLSKSDEQLLVFQEISSKLDEISGIFKEYIKLLKKDSE